MKNLLKKKYVVWIGIVLLLVALGLAGWWFSAMQQPTKAPAPGNITGLEDPLPVEVSESRNLAIKGKVEEANKKLEDALAKPNISTEEKYSYTAQIGANYANEGNLKKALELFMQAEEIKPGYFASRSVAQIAEAGGNKSVALTYFKKALSQITPEAVATYEDEKARIEASIDRLEK